MTRRRLSQGAKKESKEEPVDDDRQQAELPLDKAVLDRFTDTMMTGEAPPALTTLPLVTRVFSYATLKIVGAFYLVSMPDCQGK